MTRPPARCAVEQTLPGCDTGPAGRLRFVLREIRAAWRSHRTCTTTAGDRTANGNSSSASTSNDGRHSAPLGADGRPDLPLGGTR